MSYNGSGTFNINTTGQPVVAGTVISSSAFNALTTDLATGLTTAITKDGQTTTTARITFAQGITSSLVTDSSSVSTGSIITGGGVGIAKNLYVGVNANVAGTLGVTGVATFSAAPIYSSLTASSAVATDASKGLVSVTNTGTGNNVLATAPTIASLNLTTALTLTGASGTAGQALTSGGSGVAPTWTTISSSPTAITNGTSNVTVNSSGGSITATTAGTAAVTIDTSQNVGIGTTSPAQVLEVSNSTNGEKGIIIRNATSGTNAGSMLRFYSGTDTAAILRFPAAHSSKANELYITNVGTTSPITFATQDTERMRILSDGRVFVGTGTDFTDNPQQGLILYAANNNSQLVVSHGNGTSSGTFFAKFGYNANTIGSISQNGTTAVAYNTSSDYRLKDNVQPMTGALTKVVQLKPVTYTWKSSPEETGEGFIAHELAEVCPQAVHGTKDELDADGNPKYQGIDTSFLVATLTAAIQELKAINDTQAETINALTARIVALENA